MNYMSVRNWILNHDSSKAFVFPYFFMAVILSIALSLFWLVIVVFAHFLFECFKQAQIDSRKFGVIIRAVWEIKFDIALILFSLGLVVYLDFVFGVAGVGAAARIGGQAARMSRLGSFVSRIGGWHRMIRAFFMTIDDALIGIKGFFVKKKKGNELILKHQRNNSHHFWGSWLEKWSIGDYFSTSFAFLSLLFLLFSPIITGNSCYEIAIIVGENLKPFPNQ